MPDFVGPAHTHIYVQHLEATVLSLQERLAALEAMMTSSRSAEPYVVVAAQRALKKRNEYMRNFMAEKRRKERDRVLSEQ